MQDQNPIHDNIRSTIAARQVLVADPAAPVAISKEELIEEMKEKYPSFSHFDIENAFEQLKISNHLVEQEPGMYLFAEAFTAAK